MAVDVHAYVNPLSPPGGNGTTPSISPSDPNRAYSSRSEWDAQRRKNLVTADENHILHCAGGDDTTFIALNALWVTDATRKITVYNTDGYRLRAPHDYNHLLTINVSHYEEYDLVCEHLSTPAASSGNSAAIYVSNTAGAAGLCIFERVTVLGSPKRGITTAGGHIVVANSVIKNCQGDSGLFATYDTSQGRIYAYNNVIHDVFGVGVDGFDASYTQAKNCYSGNNGTDYGNATLTNSASSDLTGSSGLQNVPFSSTTFADVTPGAEDYHLVTGSALIDAGADLSADPIYPITSDAYGNARPQNTIYDIGIHELVTVVGHDLVVDDVMVTPFIDAATITQTHELTASDVFVIPVIDSAAITQTHEQITGDVLVTPFIDAATITQTHDLVASDVFVTPVIDPVTIFQGAAHELVGDDLFVTPFIDAATITQTHELTASDVFVIPVIDSAAITQTHEQIAGDVMVTPFIDAASITQTHQLISDDLLVTPFIDPITLPNGALGEIFNTSHISATPRYSSRSATPIYTSRSA